MWEDQVRTVVKRVLDTALPMGEMDFVHAISSEIPMQIFAEILGIPHEERREIIEIGDRLLGNQDPEFAVTETADEHRNLPFSHPAALEMFEFGRRLAADRRKHPGNDIITQLAFEPLTQQEFDTYFVLLATAGNETTRHTITHGLLALLEGRRLPVLRPASVGAALATGLLGQGAGEKDEEPQRDAGYAGTNCSSCATNYYNYPTCTFCQASSSPRAAATRRMRSAVAWPTCTRCTTGTGTSSPTRRPACATRSSPARSTARWPSCGPAASTRRPCTASTSTTATRR